MNYFFTKSFTNQGSGNKLFVYFLGHILSIKYKRSYFHPGIKELLIEPEPLPKKQKNKFPSKKLTNFDILEDETHFNDSVNYIIGYLTEPTIENYKLFYSYIDNLKIKYPIRNKKFNNNDLVYHLRAGDYLFCGNHYLLNGDKLERLLKNIEYNNFFVVTNLTKKNKWNMQDYLEYRKYYFKNGIHTKPFSEDKCVQPLQFQEVLNHLNPLIEVCNKFNCTWISDSVYEDFNTIRNFNKIIINASTLSWWAAVLSNAESVYVPERWRYKKKKNKNLPDINLKGWTKVDL